MDLRQTNPAPIRMVSHSFDLSANMEKKEQNKIQ